jgi:hypothetical protein
VYIADSSAKSLNLGESTAKTIHEKSVSEEISATPPVNRFPYTEVMWFGFNNSRIGEAPIELSIVESNPESI